MGGGNDSKFQKVRKTLTLMNLLFQLLVRKVKYVKSKEINSNSVALYTASVSRTAALQAVLKYHLDQQFDGSVRKTAFSILMELHELMGPYLSCSRKTWTLHASLDGADVYAMVEYATEMLDTNKDCHKLLMERATTSDCCCIINKTCSFVVLGLFDVDCFIPFLKGIGKCANHDELVIEALNRYAARFPHRWELLAVTIFNAFVSMLDKALPSFPSMEDIPHRYRLSHLYMNLLNLTQYLVGKAKFSNANIMKFVSVKLHLHMIELALRPDGPRAVLELIYAVREMLANEDVNVVMTFLSQLRTDNRADVTRYYNFLKQSVYKYDSTTTLVTNTAGILYRVTY